MPGSAFARVPGVSLAALADSQTPRVRIMPAPSVVDDSMGRIGLEWLGTLGLHPDPWQGEALVDSLTRNAAGRWLGLTFGLSMPRQNGKNVVLEFRELVGSALVGEKFLHTAHELKSAAKHFRRMRYYFGEQPNDPQAKFPALNAMVAEVRKSNGQEAIFLHNGGSIEFIARTRNSGRGFTVDVLVCDEAQTVSDDDLEALLSATSAAPLGNPQWIYTGTPPAAGADGGVFRGIRAEALGANPGAVGWLEWSPEPGTDRDDRDEWARTNPGMAMGRLAIEVAEGERARFSDDGFARERLGDWTTGATSGAVVSPEVLALTTDDESRAVDAIALAVAVAPDLETASVALAGVRADGLFHVELAEHRAGADWVPLFLSRTLAANPGVVRSVVVDAGSPSKAIMDAIGAAGIQVTTPRTTDVGAACDRLVSGLRAGTVRHIGQVQLVTAMGQARRRRLGQTGLWAWARSTGLADITPVEAVTLALWGSTHGKVARPTRTIDRTKRRGGVY